MSDQPESAVPQVYQAIQRVMQFMSRDGVAKDRKNEQQRYNFRGIDDVMNALSHPLSEAELLFLPRIVERQQVERQTKNGSPLFYTTVTAEFDLISVVDGSRHTIRTVGEAMDSADKSSNKAMSAAYKYAALQAFCIPTEGDNDADATTHEVAAKDATPPTRDDRPAPRPAEKKPIAQRLIDAVQGHQSIDALDTWVADPAVIKATNGLSSDDLEALNSALAKARNKLDPDGCPF